MKILFTGGGTGGHFYPIIAVAESINRFAREQRLLAPELYFMSPTPYDERALFENNIIFRKTGAGKIRRYFSFLNIIDVFKTALGVLKALFTVFNIYPDVVFAKGSYSSFPTLFAARVLHIPVVIHESDSKPGKVNLWASKFAARIAISYPQAAEYFPQEKVALTGNPVRREITTPLSEGAREFLKLEEGTPVILIIGGSQGAQIINEAILDALPKLVENYQIIHQTGEKNFKIISETASVILENSVNKERYRPFAYLNILALRMSAGVASIVISRAGSTLFEIAAWGIPAIVIPIPEEVSHDQLANAFSYARSGAAIVIEEKNLTPSILLFEIEKLMNDQTLRVKMSEAGKKMAKTDAADKIANEILNIALPHEA